MSKHNYKKKIIASLINKKKQMKLYGDANNVIDIQLLEIPALAIGRTNGSGKRAKNETGRGEINADKLIKEVPPPKFKRHKKIHLIDATADTIVDMPFTETYQSDFNDARRVAKVLDFNVDK